MSTFLSHPSKQPHGLGQGLILVADRRVESPTDADMV